MDQLAMLWQYQVEDRKADKLEQELSRSPLRQKMNTCRTQFNAKQKQYKQMEEQVAILSDRKDAIRDAITRCEEQGIAGKGSCPEGAEGHRRQEGRGHFAGAAGPLSRD